MAFSGSRFVAALGMSAAFFFVAAPFSLAAAPTASDPSVMTRLPPDVPVGLRVGMARPNGDPGLGNVGGSSRGGQAIVLVDGPGRPLFYATAGCDADCLTRWAPALAEADAVPTSQLTIVTNAAGQRQWAFHGQPLYTPINGPNFSTPLVLPEWDLLRPPPTLGVAVEDKGRDGMKLTILNPKTWMKMPYSIGVAEYRLAPGQVLAVGVTGSTPMGRPLYTYSGPAEQEQDLPAAFKPHYASAISLPVGDFSVRTRSDGSQQWVWKGAPLYTCDCDISLGDLNGAGLAAGIQPAVAFAYVNPKEVIVKKDPLSVGRMVEASTGRTLYYRDRLEDDYQPDHTRPMIGTQDARVGAMLGLAHCDAKCEKEWRPLFAPKDAKPQGYWTIYERPDGKRQWAYKNYALYTYLKEGPGRLDGNERYLVQFEDGTGASALPKEFGLGLNWRAVVP